jgi:ESS family glutamate:Na+ symporter
LIDLQTQHVVLVRAFLAVTVGILVLFAGKAINQRVGPLRNYNIPEPVTGGLLVAISLWMVYLATGYRVTFELTARDVLLVYFFTTIGLNARVSDLKAGGRPLVLLLTAVAVFLVVQNVAGIATARLFGLPPAVGLLAGSVSMIGGHGTSIAWAPTFASQHNVPNALEIGVLCATAGLVLAGVVGGPVGRYLIEHHGLHGRHDAAPAVGVTYGDAEPQIDYLSFLRAVLAIHLSGVIGILVHQWLTRLGANVPLFLPCLMAGIVLTNIVPRVAPRVLWPTGTPALALIAEITLGVFLAMSLMSMQLWTLAELAGPLCALLGVQVVLAILFAVFLAFPILGRDYDAAVICSGLIGFGLGPTPTAIANMTALTQRYGASPVAFLVVPLVGAFFGDLLNFAVIHLFLLVV